MKFYRLILNNVYAKFGGSLRILSDNGTEFKNHLFETVTTELGVKHKIYTAPYRPSSNGCIEGFHNFLKACISKHVSPQLEWTSVVPLACAAYNFLPNEHSKESPFFMFGRDAVLPLNSLLSPQFHYLGNDLNVLSLEALKNMFHITAENLHHVLTMMILCLNNFPITLLQVILYWLKIILLDLLIPSISVITALCPLSVIRSN